MFACVARSFGQVVLDLPLGLVLCRRLSFAILNTLFCSSVRSMSAYRRTYALALAIATFCFASFFAVL